MKSKYIKPGLSVYQVKSRFSLLAGTDIIVYEDDTDVQLAAFMYAIYDEEDDEEDEDY